MVLPLPARPLLRPVPRLLNCISPLTPLILLILPPLLVLVALLAWLLSVALLTPPTPLT